MARARSVAFSGGGGPQGAARPFTSNLEDPSLKRRGQVGGKTTKPEVRGQARSSVRGPGPTLAPDDTSGLPLAGHWHLLRPCL